jgi:hypothetical protein
MSRTAAGIQYNARSMNGIISINADEITCSGTITSDLIKANNLLEADTPETISGLWNFTTLPYSSVSAVNGTDFTNLNSVNSAISSSLTGYVTLGTTQTITAAKVINANLRLNNTRQLIFGTTTGAVLNFTGANMYYDNQAGGGHYFFISGSPNLYIDSTGLNIESGKRIWFNGGRCSITDNGTQLSYDVPTGNSHSFRTNNVQRLTIDGNGINLATDNRIFFASGSRIVEEGSFSNILYDTPTGFKHQFRVNNFDTMAVSADANGSVLTFPAGTIMREYTSFNWFLYQLPAGHTLKYQVGGNEIFEIQSGGAILYEGLSMRNGKSVIWNEGFTEIAQIRKDSVNKYLEYEVASTYRHRFSVNNVEKLSVNTSGATFSTDIKLKFGSSFFPNDATGATMQGTGAGGFRFDSDISADYKFYGDSTLLTTIDATGVIINSTAVGAGIPAQKLYLSANKLNYVDATTTNIRYNCPTSGSHSFLQNGTLIGSFNSLLLNLHTNNTSFQMGTTSPIQIKHDTATSQLQYRTLGSFNHMFYIDGSLWYEMRTDTFRALRGYQNKLGALGAYVLNNFNFSWNNPVPGLSVWIDTTRLGTMTISDYRVKECIVPARPVLDRLCKVKMYEYEHKNISIFKKSGRHHGFIAHEFQELFPELNNIIAGEKDALTDDGKVQPQSIQPELTNLYLSAIQELNAKIEAQQKVIENQQKQIDQLIVLFSQSRV